MSDSPEQPKSVDLSSLQMMPDWVTELGSEPPAKEYQKFEEPAEGGARRIGGRGREGGMGRDQRGFGARGGAGAGGRIGGGARTGDRGPRRDGRSREGGDRERREHPGGRGEGRGGPRGEQRRVPVPEGLQVEVSATPGCLEALVGRIKMSGRTFGMFDLAKVVLGARDRIEVEFIRREPEKAPRLYRSGEGEETSLWTDRLEAARRLLRKEAVDKYYRVEETEVEPPKGDFKAVAVCGLSGQIIGPPNHHSYQTAVLRLHRERFSKMPLAHYKTKIRTETDEELVNRWRQEQSRQTRYIYPREQVEGVAEVVLDSLDAVERHFFSEICQDVVQEVDRATVPGQIPGRQISPELLTLLRQEVEGLQRNPFSLVKRLCGQLERRGLKIFKRQGKKLFVSKARPRAFDPQVPLSDDVNLIVNCIRSRPGVRVSELVTFLAPRGSDHPQLKPGELTPRETAILTHLRWLIDEGFVIEYSSTALFLGVQSAKAEAEEEAAARASSEDSSGEPAEASAQEESDGAGDASSETQAEAAGFALAETEPGRAETEPEEAPGCLCGEREVELEPCSSAQESAPCAADEVPSDEGAEMAGDGLESPGTPEPAAGAAVAESAENVQAVEEIAGPAQEAVPDPETAQASV